MYLLCDWSARWIKCADQYTDIFLILGFWNRFENSCRAYVKYCIAISFWVKNKQHWLIICHLIRLFTILASILELRILMKRSCQWHLDYLSSHDKDLRNDFKSVSRNIYWTHWWINFGLFNIVLMLFDRNIF